MKRMLRTALMTLLLSTLTTVVYAQTAMGGSEARVGDKPAAATTARQPDPVGGPLPGKVVDQLGLTAGQKSLLDSAMTARQASQAANTAARDAAYQTLTEQLSSDKFDPRAVVKQREQARIAMDARVDAVQQKWLLFWDSLSQTQRNTLVQYMREQHAALAKQRSK